MVNTIARLLSNNEKYRLEFKKVNGYDVLDKFFNSISMKNSEDNETKLFIESLFEILM